jgi:hypothetical protein
VPTEWTDPETLEEHTFNVVVRCSVAQNQPIVIDDIRDEVCVADPSELVSEIRPCWVQ